MGSNRSVIKRYNITPEQAFYIDLLLKYPEDIVHEKYKDKFNSLESILDYFKQGCDHQFKIENFIQDIEEVIDYDLLVDLEGSFEESDIQAPWAGRNLETESVYTELSVAFPGEYVGWTRYYGGGKHSDLPGLIEQVTDAYWVDVDKKMVEVDFCTKRGE